MRLKLEFCLLQLPDPVVDAVPTPPMPLTSNTVDSRELLVKYFLRHSTLHANDFRKARLVNYVTVCLSPFADEVGEEVISKVWPPSTNKHIRWFQCGKLKCYIFIPNITFWAIGDHTRKEKKISDPGGIRTYTETSRNYYHVFPLKVHNFPGLFSKYIYAY